MNVQGTVNVLSEAEEELIRRDALRLLDEVGFVIEHPGLVHLFADYGAKVNATESRVHLPERLVEDFLAQSAADYDEPIPGVEYSCTLPYRDRAARAKGIECTAGTYPAMYLDLEGTIRPHTVKTVIGMTALAARLEHIDRLGAMGVPSDVPPAVVPLHQRLIAWNYACQKRSGCGEVWNRALFPYIVEMGRIISSHTGRPIQASTYGEVEFISPLRFGRHEAAIFADFWKAGLLCGIGFVHSAGGTAPATLAGTLVLNLAENIVVNMLYRFCHGFRKLWFQTNASVMDMKAGMFPFGRPERALMILAVGQIARRFRAGLWASSIFPDAKLPTCEAGMQSAFNVIPAILAGSLGLECFGLLSGAELNSPVQLVIDNEFAGALKRFASGFAVNEETLGYEVIRTAGPGGFFTAHEHTVRHFRSEHWQPSVFSRENLNSWIASGRKTDVDHARDICRSLLSEDPVGILPPDVEADLRGVIARATKDLV